MNSKKLGNNIKRVMKEKNISTQTMSCKLKVSYQAVWKILEGKALPTLEHFYDICRILKVKPSALLEALDT